MMKQRRTHSIAASLLALVLCCVLAAGSFATPVSAAPPPGGTSDNVQAEVEAGLEDLITEGEEFAEPNDQGDTDSDGTGDPQTDSDPVDPDSPPQSTDPDNDTDPSDPEVSPNPQEPEESPEPSEPEEVVYTVTFKLSGSQSVQVEVKEGEYPQALQDITPPPMAEFQGWANAQGQLVNPEEIPVTQDVTYTARWSRQLEDLLNTATHINYIDGYEDGLFRPSKAITRGEAATMLYKLLLQQDWEKKTFPDISEKDWYANAVETLAGLGILSGYTDGTFAPGRQITRAEFVTMVTGFTTLDTEITQTFSDVPATSWAAAAVSTAAQLGWVNGYGDGTFLPNNPITRAEAVKVINNMLGRAVDPQYKNKSDVKNFYDLFSEHWAYGDIVEASTPHTVEEGSNPEVWTSYTADTSTVKGHWVTEGGVRYYVDPSTRKFARGQITIDGVKYRFDSKTAKPLTGFYMDGQWRRYYKNGAIVNDISGLGVVKGPYYIKVYKPANYLIIFAKDSSGNYNTPVRAMRVSCGNATPTGTYYTPARYRWLKMVGNTWAQWCTQIQGNYLFHSVPNWTKNNLDLEVGEYNRLGETRSLGCIRLNCRDAKWIYDNCALGTKVYISPTETSGPLSKPAGIQIPSWHTWDPTDPTAYYMCDKYGCHQDLH